MITWNISRHWIVMAVAMVMILGVGCSQQSRDLRRVKAAAGRAFPTLKFGVKMDYSDVTRYRTIGDFEEVSGVGNIKSPGGKDIYTCFFLERTTVHLSRQDQIEVALAGTTCTISWVEQSDYDPAGETKWSHCSVWTPLAPELGNAVVRGTWIAKLEDLKPERRHQINEIMSEEMRKFLIEYNR